VNISNGKGSQTMRRSKMEMYIDILKVIAQNGPMKLTHVMYKANVNCSVLKQNLDFLIEQNLLEEQITSKRRNRTKIRYAITEKGRTVIKYFNEVNRALQITEESKIPALIR
jgi:predicted transcriptional regulator